MRSSSEVLASECQFWLHGDAWNLHVVVLFPIRLVAMEAMNGRHGHKWLAPPLNFTSRSGCAIIRTQVEKLPMFTL